MTADEVRASMQIAPEAPSTGPAVYQRIADVSAELARVGVAKTSKNEQQGYRFRGIDAMYNALAPLLAKHGLVILPRFLSRTVTERTTAKGGVLFYVVVDVEFDFVAAVDGSRHAIRLYGEAMDSGDKATNKAMSAAYKYAVMQAFCIPTEGDNDADATTHEVVATAPKGFEDWWMDLQAVAEHGIEALRAAWKQSSEERRNYLTTTNNKEWEALKKRAGAVVAPVVPA
jgi:hypothetical protein